MKKRWLRWLVCLALLLPLTTATVRADCAPKPSVNVDVICGRNVIVTLLADQEGYGPNHTIAPGENPGQWQEYNSKPELRAWERFRDYQDPDGFHFWGWMEWHGIDWSYYCPDRFKIAVYFPDSDVLIVSQEIYEAYAFHSDYRVWIQELDYADGQIVSMDLQKNVDWMEETWDFFIRVVITLSVEISVALLFGYRKTEHFRLILFVNLVTQVGLNLLVSVWYFFEGYLSALVLLILAELVVLAVELIFYCRRLRAENRAGGWAALYTIMANLASVYIGWHLLD